MTSISSRLTIAGLLLLSASPFGAANARSPTSGITVSLRLEITVPPDQVICTGACSRGTYLDLTVWKDGRMVVDGASRPRVSRQDAARFSKILLPFRPTGSGATSDPSSWLSPDLCSVKVQWPVDKHGGQAVVCDIYSGSLFPAVMQALRSIHVDIAVPATCAWDPRDPNPCNGSQAHPRG